MHVASSPHEKLLYLIPIPPVIFYPGPESELFSVEITEVC
jgi:hypothetical protein